jgi:hypothetical protein
MPYQARGVVIDPTTGKQEPGTGTLEAMADTLQDALARARGLRTQGFAVSITGPDGEPIPEMDEGTGPPRKATLDGCGERSG